MRTYLDCLPCFLAQALDACRRVTDDEAVHERVLRRVLEVARGLDFERPPPEMGAAIHAVIREETGRVDPYAEVKARSNELALAALPGLEARVAAAEDPFEAAARLAIAGNIMDFAVVDRVDEELLQRTIEDCLARPLAVDDVAELERAAAEASSILYLADNAGEIVLDRLLIGRLDPRTVTLAVRGSPVINDATREDAEAAGLPGLVTVIDSGSDVPGTSLARCSARLREAFERADLVISKGQGNYETLSGSEREVFFLLKAKCPMAARDLGCEVGDIVVARGPRR